MKRKPLIEGCIATLPLTRGYFAVFDKEFVEDVCEYNWYADIKGCNVYAARTLHVKGKKRKIYMHRVIAKAEDGVEVDHINGNGLDNRLENIRITSRKWNSKNYRKPVTNTSGEKGVSWSRGKNKWHATISNGNKDIHIGYFENIVDASNAYKKAAKKYHRDFVRM